MARRITLAALALCLCAVRSQAATMPIETSFDVVPHAPGVDTFTRSIWETSGGLPGFSKAKAGYSIYTSAADAIIHYDWRIPGYPVKGQLFAGTFLFIPYGFSSEIQWTSETCNLTPAIKTASAVFHYQTTVGFPTTSGPAQYHEPVPDTATCYPLSQPDTSEFRKTTMNILDDDHDIARTLADFDSAVEMTDDGQYEYTYTVANETNDRLLFAWTGVSLSGFVEPLSEVRFVRISPFAPIELLIHANASFESIIEDAAPAAPGDLDPLASAAGVSMGGPSVVLVPVPEPTMLAPLLLAGGLLRRRGRSGQ